MSWGAILLLACTAVQPPRGPTSLSPSAKRQKTAELYKQLYTGQYAVVIGVEDYGFRHDLRGPARDACRMAHYLRDQGADVLCCFEKGPNGKLDFTRPSVPRRDHLLEMTRSLPGADRRLIFYLSGHSATLQVPSEEAPGRLDKRTLFFMPQPDPQASRAVAEPSVASALSTENAEGGPYADECRGTSPRRAPENGTLGRQGSLESKLPVGTESEASIRNGRALIARILEQQRRPLSVTEAYELIPYTLDLSEWYHSGARILKDGEEALSTVIIADGCDLEVNTMETKGLLARHSALGKKSTLWILATSGGQASLTHRNRSVFTDVLLRGLCGDADEPASIGDRGLIRGTELQDYLDVYYARSYAEAARNSQNGPSAPPSPNVGYTGGFGETVFVVPEQLQSAEFAMDRARPFDWSWVGYATATALAVGPATYWALKHRERRDAVNEYENADAPTERQRRIANDATQSAKNWQTVAVASAGAGLALFGVVLTLDLARQP